MTSRLRSRYKLGRYAGISVYAHWSLLAALAGLFIWMLWRGGSWSLAVDALLMIVALFGCVVLHEFGHALMARRFGIPTLNITIYPVGGVALLSRMPRDPRQEFLIAVAGPAVNLFIAAALFVYLLVDNSMEGFGLVVRDDGQRLDQLSTLMSMNVLLVAFNLVPAFPMDGGRVLRSTLAMRLSYRAATRIASYTGQLLAVVFALLAIFPNPLFRGFNPILLFIAWFVFAGARAEAKQVLRTTGSSEDGQTG